MSLPKLIVLEGWKASELGEGVHVAPTYGRAHELKWSCWCKPRVEVHATCKVWFHHDRPQA